MNNLVPPRDAKHIALFLANLEVGGVQKMLLNLAGAIAAHGHQVDLVVCRMAGPLVDQIPNNVRVVGLKEARTWKGRIYALAADPGGFWQLLRPVLLAKKPSRTLLYLPDLVRYLQRERPATLLSAMPHSNLEALWARRLAGTGTRIVVSEQNMLSHNVAAATKARRRLLPRLMGRTYPEADAIVAASDGVAEDLSVQTGISRHRITTIPNLAVMPEIPEQAKEVLDHPWFAPGSAPVVLGVGRLTRQKDFPTLIRAFARVRAQRDVRLMILGAEKNPIKNTQRRNELTDLAAELGVAEDLALPGFVSNPFAYMARAAVFVLSSAWEGFGNVVAEAMACSCPVVSTDCPSGPAEILNHGEFGSLVPVGNDEAMADAILAALETSPDRHRLQTRAAEFSIGPVVERYLKVLDGGTASQDDGAASQDGGAASQEARLTAAE